jgi:peptidoglycan hydrolase-like protein with peptidoglycan-binding domain
LAHFYSIFSSGNPPDLVVRQVQMMLVYRGYAPGSIDGRMGTNTANAIKAFQAGNGLPPTGEIDDGLLGAL